MKAKILSISLLLIGAVSLSACSKNDKEKSVDWGRTETTGRYVSDDGWVYTFTHTEYENNTSDEFNFLGINLRYRYNDAYMTEPVYDEDGELVIGPMPKKIQVLGESDSEAIKKDMSKISEMLGYSTNMVTKEDLLALDRATITFEELDKDLYFKLMDECFEAEPNPTGNYVELPSYALLEEPEYIDGYKYQVGFISGLGTIDVMYIDVLYKNGDEYDSYIQLSDMVDGQTATDEQEKAFELISDISDGIVENNNLTYGQEENGKSKVADLDLSRLYTFLEDIGKYEYLKYAVD